MTIVLTKEDLETLACALGYATGMALMRAEPGNARRIIALANKINACQPGWVPMEMPSEASD